MKMNKPKFWEDGNSLIPFFLFPFAFLFQIILKIKKIITVKERFDIPKTLTKAITPQFLLCL